VHPVTAPPAAYAAAAGVPAAAAISPRVTRIAVLPLHGVVGVGRSTRMVLTLRAANGAIVRGRPVTWSSSDTTLATVDPSGIVRAVADRGAVTIRVSVDGLTAETVVRLAVYANDFEADSVGLLTADGVRERWNWPPWTIGPHDGRVSIVDGSEAYAGRSLRIRYPAGSQSGDVQNTGMSVWVMPLPASYDSLYASYRVYFPPEFEFVRGGKLPGLAGGTGPSGGGKPTGRDGWSARMMWVRFGRAIQYVYHPDQPGSSGQSFRYAIGKQRVHMAGGRWHHVEHQIVMNTPGKKDGVMRAWMDGELVLEVKTMRFRDVATFGIDKFMFSSFFGGATPDHAARKDEHALFDDFVIATHRVGALPIR